MRVTILKKIPYRKVQLILSHLPAHSSTKARSTAYNKSTIIVMQHQHFSLSLLSFSVHRQQAQQLFNQNVLFIMFYIA
jgi:hypothetical protein